MSIENIEKLIVASIENYKKGGNVNLILFFEAIVDTFKHQSDQIADLRQELAKKDAIDINSIKVGGTD